MTIDLLTRMVQKGRHLLVQKRNYFFKQHLLGSFPTQMPLVYQICMGTLVSGVQTTGMAVMTEHHP
jgi:hypothetical protein